MNACLRRTVRSGFTLVELVIVIAVLGILSSVAIPRFLDFTPDAREAATKGALGGVRASIANFYAKSALPSSGLANPRFPTANELNGFDPLPWDAAAFGIMGSNGGALPPNPYWVEGGFGSANLVNPTPLPKGTHIPGDVSDYAWGYDPVTGDFWAYTDSGAGEYDF